MELLTHPKLAGVLLRCYRTNPARHVARMRCKLQIWFVRMLRGGELVQFWKMKRSMVWEVICLSGIQRGQQCEDKRREQGRKKGFFFCIQCFASASQLLDVSLLDY